MNERPDRHAIDGFWDITPRRNQPGWYHRLLTRCARWFGEHNFAAIQADHRQTRERRIQLERYSVEVARRLNGTGFHGLNLEEDEIVIVICETARILTLEEKVRATLDDLRLPSHLRGEVAERAADSRQT